MDKEQSDSSSTCQRFVGECYRESSVGACSHGAEYYMRRGDTLYFRMRSGKKFQFKLDAEHRSRIGLIYGKWYPVAFTMS